MNIKFSCERCGQEFKADESWFNQSFTCPSCQHNFEILPIDDGVDDSKTLPVAIKTYPQVKKLMKLIGVCATTVLLLALGSALTVYAIYSSAIFFTMIATAIAMGIYFLPTIIGLRKKNFAGIFILNLFLGWTFLGWVIALVWACCND